MRSHKRLGEIESKTTACDGSDVSVFASAELLKEASDSFCVHAASGIGDGDEYPVVLSGDGDGNGARRSVLDGVAEQIAEYFFHFW